MPKIAGVPHLRAVRALQKAGFEVAREGARHIVMKRGNAFITIPRHDPVDAYTLGGIVSDAGWLGCRMTGCLPCLSYPRVGTRRSYGNFLRPDWSAQRRGVPTYRQSG